MILGTAAYMPPEQARGMAVDKRADLWAFGVIVWEMLTGRHLFDGATVSDTLASVLKTEPQWNALRPDTPSSVRRLLRRCLEKDRRRRLADAADARLEIDDALSGAHGDVPLAPAISRRRGSLVWASALVLAGLTVGAVVSWPAPRPSLGRRPVRS
jgi:eukaryotic-like serine/threonine-protein kinase